MARTTEVVRPRNDAYTGLLAISFLALVGAAVMMYLDADALGKAPPPLKIDVPGATAGPKGEGLTRPAIGAPGPAAPGVPAPGGMGKAEPRALPPLPAEVAAAAVPPPPVAPVKAETEAKADPDAPPLPLPAFVPPGN